MHLKRLLQISLISQLTSAVKRSILPKQKCNISFKDITLIIGQVKVVNQVKNIVTNVINSNKTKISTELSKGKPVDIYKTINGIKYKVHIGKDGYVKSAYLV